MPKEDLENYNKLMTNKAEKVVTAIYLISQFMSDKESLKFSLRSSANSLLSLMNNISNEHPDNKNIFVFYREALKNTKEIISFLSVAKDSNMISKMNSEIVIESMKKLEEILSKKQFSFNQNFLKVEGEERLQDSNFLNDNNFNSINNVTDIENKNTFYGARFTESESKLNLEKNKNIDLINLPESIFKQDEKENTTKKEISIRQNTQKNIPIQDKTSSIRQNKKQINKSVLIQERKENRRDQILNIFIKDKEYSIKDIAKRVPGCSEKTVSRELENLVKENKLNRKGERRWARYFLD